jgi:protein-tyrosine phosphatase
MNILLVCTGNICRSPMAQQMLDRQIELMGIQGVSVKSAGTLAVSSQGLDFEISQAMHSLGVEPKNHSAQQLTPQLIVEADLVLTATSDQRAEVVESLLSANRYSFTLLEFSVLAEYMVESDSQGTFNTHEELFEEAKQLRGYGRYLSNLDIEDPYRSGVEVATRVAIETQKAIEWVAKWLRLA